MQDVRSNNLDVLRERHFYIPLTDTEMERLDSIKRLTGKAKKFFVREAIIEKFHREHAKKKIVPIFPGVENRKMTQHDH